MQGPFALSLWLAFAFSRGESIRINAPLQNDVPLPQDDIPQAVFRVDDGLVQPMAAAEPHSGQEIPQARRAKWTVKCDSEQPNYACNNAVHGRSGSCWQTRQVATGTQNTAPWPQNITIDLQIVETVNALRMTPCFNAATVAGHKLYLSLDSQKWGDPVAFGTWYEDEEG